MIQSIIQGGFGNQLFQYAMGYALAKHLNNRLILDVSFYDYSKGANNGGPVRVNNLDKLNLADPQFVNRPSSYRHILLGAKFHRTWLSGILGFQHPVIWEDVANCRQYQYNIIKKANKLKDFILYGFWQNTKYFDDVIYELKEQFRPNYDLDHQVKDIQNQILQSDESVGIHVRRGDFVGLGWAEGADYYLRAINKMKQSLGDCNCFIVSDDKEWAKKHFSKIENVKVIDIKTPTCDIDEFFLLSLCRHQIISESTFGWWAAYLNTNPERKIVIPSSAKGEMFPESWIRI